jgi:hypothetical protein
MIASRFAKTAATSSLEPETASRTPGTAFARLNTSCGRSNVLLGQQATVALATDQKILDERYSKACRCKIPHGGHTAHPPPTTITSKSLPVASLWDWWCRTRCSELSGSA